MFLLSWVLVVFWTWIIDVFCQMIFQCLLRWSYMILVFKSTDIMTYTYWFLCVKTIFHPWDKHHGALLFNVLYAICQIFILRIFASMFIKNIYLKFSFLDVCVFGFGIRAMVASYFLWCLLWRMDELLAYPFGVGKCQAWETFLAKTQGCEPTLDTGLWH